MLSASLVTLMCHLLRRSKSTSIKNELRITDFCLTNRLLLHLTMLSPLGSLSIFLVSFDIGMVRSSNECIIITSPIVDAYRAIPPRAPIGWRAFTSVPHLSSSRPTDCAELLRSQTKLAQAFFVHSYHTRILLFLFLYPPRLIVWFISREVSPSASIIGKVSAFSLCKIPFYATFWSISESKDDFLGLRSCHIFGMFGIFSLSTGFI